MQTEERPTKKRRKQEKDISTTTILNNRQAAIAVKLQKTGEHEKKNAHKNHTHSHSGM